jgi:pimeloyl-ACP methyl ester carboxylesterase
MAMTPAEQTDALAAQARVVKTPCGRGEMVWRIWGKEGAQPVLLFHGGSGSWRHWFKTIPALAGTYEVIAPDLPGMGDSGIPQGQPVPQTLADTVVEGLQEAILPGRAKPHVVGFSFGGHIGGLVSRMIGDRLRDLTLVGVAALGLPHREGRPLERYHSEMTPEEIDRVDRINLGILMISKPEHIDDLAIYLHAESLRRARFRSAPYAPNDELKRALADIRIPVKTIWGRDDVIAQPDLETRLKVISEHHPELIARIVDDAGHWVMYEQADAFNRALLEILPL